MSLLFFFPVSLLCNNDATIRNSTALHKLDRIKGLDPPYSASSQRLVQNRKEAMVYEI